MAPTLPFEGSVTWRVFPQVLVITVISAVVTILTNLHHINLGISNILISVLGFVVSLCLSFRTSSAYANWKEGRTAWDHLSSTCRNMARVIWVNCPADGSSSDALRKKSAINLLAAFPVALKHHLREERGHLALDIKDLIPHLATFGAMRLSRMGATHVSGYSKAESSRQRSTVNATKGKRGSLKDIALEQLHKISKDPSPHRSAHYLYSPSPTDTQANAIAHLGTLPTEITYYLASFIEWTKTERGADVQATYVSFDLISARSKVFKSRANSHRPLAYNIVISQMVWIFLLALPFQLQPVLSWISIPMTTIAACMLFGMAEIGLEIENPWGEDANDLDIDRYAQAIAIELDTLTALPPPDFSKWTAHPDNHPLYPMSNDTFEMLTTKRTEEIEDMLKEKAMGLAYWDPHELMGERTLFAKRKSRHMVTPQVSKMNLGGLSHDEDETMQGSTASLCGSTNTRRSPSGKVFGSCANPESNTLHARERGHLQSDEIV